jgi:hypothetical protein
LEFSINSFDVPLTKNVLYFNTIPSTLVAPNNDVTVSEYLSRESCNCFASVDNNVLKELVLYIKYVNTQEMYLNNAEQEKEKYKNTFFLKGNKDIST